MTCSRYFDVDGAVECWSCDEAKEGVGERLNASGKFVDTDEEGMVGEVEASVKA